MAVFHIGLGYMSHIVLVGSIMMCLLLTLPRVHFQFGLFVCQRKNYQADFHGSRWKGGSMGQERTHSVLKRIQIVFYVPQNRTLDNGLFMNCTPHYVPEIEPSPSESLLCRSICLLTCFSLSLPLSPSPPSLSLFLYLPLSLSLCLSLSLALSLSLRRLDFRERVFWAARLARQMPLDALRSWASCSFV